MYTNLRRGSYEEITFYSHFGNGDIFNTREIVREIISNNTGEFYYAHTKGEKLLRDLNLTYTKIHEFMKPTLPFVIGQVNDLYINTWIGRDSKYVLPGIGVTLEKYIIMFNKILEQTDLRSLEGTLYDYLPTIDYSFFNLNSIDKFIDEHEEKKILISNGNVQSQQSKNFNFTPIISELCINYPNYIFIISENINLKFNNLYTTYDIINNELPDLNEISYLSLFCDVIIGRASSPYVFCQVKENYLDPNKTFINFTYSRYGADLVQTLDLPRKLIWSNNFSQESILEIIGKEL